MNEHAAVFADLCEYTRLTEQLGDEASARMATALFDIAAGVAHRHGGRVVKTLGDGVHLHFDGPADAVPASLELMTLIRSSGQPSGPCRMSSMCRSYVSFGGTAACMSSCALTASASSGTRPSRRETRCTCVSTGKYGRPSEKRRTHAAVFGPTPFSPTSRSHSATERIFANARESSGMPLSRTVRRISRRRT